MTIEPQINPTGAENLSLPLSSLLRLSTYASHKGVDDLIMESGALDCDEKYRNFVRFQHQLMTDVEHLYRRKDLLDMIPDLPSRSRLEAAGRDAKYLGIDVGESSVPKLDLASLPVPEALGWLYVVEGSKLGAAFLSKAVRKLGFSDENGAAHLAAAPEGRGAHWRSFVEALNAVQYVPSQESRVTEGAQKAFERVRQLIAANLA